MQTRHNDDGSVEIFPWWEGAVEYVPADAVRLTVAPPRGKEGVVAGVRLSRLSGSI